MEARSLIHERKTSCSICDSGNLADVLDLPDLPATGIYVESPDPEAYPNVNQGLQLCRECGHGQLRNCLDPTYLYGSDYTHRSSLSPIATSGNDFFFRFLERITKGRTFKRVVEIGCNDLYLLQKLGNIGEHLLGVDPAWHEDETRLSEKIKIVAEFAENVDYARELGGRPDLIVSAHTFEHMIDPKPQLMKLMEAANEEALFILEVPGFDSLLTNCRFDQVFHQHIHYFSMASFLRMLDEVGGTYLTHVFNYEYWGGTMLVAFKKGGQKTANLATASHGCITPTEVLIRERFASFQRQLASFMQSVESLKSQPVFGFGAAQMLPILAYHMKSELSFLECILDDNPRRNGLTYPRLAVRIRQPRANFTLRDASVVITALDSLRPIFQRIAPMNPRHILVPLQMM